MANEGTGTAGPDARREAENAVRESLGRLREQGSGLTDEAKQQVSSVFGRQKEGAASQIDGVAQALQRTADELKQQELPQIASYTGRAAEGLRSLASALREKDVGMLIRDTEGYARRHPEVFLGGAVVAGFCLARLLRSSGQRATGSGYSQGATGGGYAQGADRTYASDAQAASPTGPAKQGAATGAVTAGTAGAYVPPNGGV